MKTDGKISSPKVKTVRTNNSQGVVESTKVIVAQLSLPYSLEALEFVGELCDAPLVLSMDASQRPLAIGLGDAPRVRPRANGGEHDNESIEGMEEAPKPGRKRAKRSSHANA